MPLYPLRNVKEDMTVMQEEIFGPILPIMRYRKVEEAIGYVNRHDRPLGLYYFGADPAEQRQVLDRTVSGGVTVNDVVFHAAMDDLPFGGIGPSGMGSYHGEDGFREFSHRKSIYPPDEERHRPCGAAAAALRRGHHQISGVANQALAGGWMPSSGQLC